MVEARGKVIEVDFRARCRVRAVAHRAPQAQALPLPLSARQALGHAGGFLVFWRPPARRVGGEYLGGRWDWGWTLFVWTNDAAVGPVWADIVDARGYVPQRLSRSAFMSLLRGAQDVGGLLLDGELEGSGQVIRAEADQLIPRDDALAALTR
ncbi:MAG: hypothetical protein U0807_07140 [Candidatus Binatia bacterium]